MTPVMILITGLAGLVAGVALLLVGGFIKNATILGTGTTLIALAIGSLFVPRPKDV